MRGDEQEPDMRCGTLGTSWHVTAKSSIHDWGVLYKSGVYARKVVSLTRGDLHAVRGIGLRGRQLPLTGMQKSAEGIVVGKTDEGLNGTRNWVQMRGAVVR